MGSYTQPSQVLDETHSNINKGFAQIETDIANKLKANRLQAIEDQKLLERQRIERSKLDLKRQKDLNLLKGKERDAGINVVHSVEGAVVGEEEGYSNIRINGNIVKVKRSNVVKAQELREKSKNTTDKEEQKKIREELLKLDEETGFDVMSFDINEDDFGGIQFGIEEDLNYLYKQLAQHEPNSAEYEFTVGLIEQVLDEAPVLVSLLNKTTENNASAYNLNGELLKPERGINGILLDDGAPNFELRAEVSKHIIFGTKQGRFSYESVGNQPTKQGQFSGSSYILYTAENGETLKIGYDEYKKLVEDGGGLIGTTNGEPYNKAIKKIWDQNKNAYKKLSDKSINTSTQNQGDRKVTIRETVQSFDNANANLEASITDFVYNGGMNNVEGKIPGYNYAQNFWQMSGGPDGSPEMRVWNNSDEQKKRLSTLLTENIKREYANETNITNYNITNKEYNNEQEQESTAILTEGLLLDAEISEKYFKSKNSLDNNNKAEYGYQDIRDNYKTLSNNGFRGAAAMLTDLDTSNKKTYRSGADMNTQLVKDNNYKLLDENGNPVMQADPSKLYVDIGNNNTYLELNVTDFPSLINEVKNARGTKKSVHEKAIKKINTETPIDETSEVKKGDEEQFNVIEIADQFA